MTKHLPTFALVTALTMTSFGDVRAQQPAPQAPGSPAAAQPAKEPAPLLLKVQLVISRYQGEKKVSSQPYMLSVNANGRSAKLQMGLQVAIPATGPDGKSTVMYKDVGTNIDCAARSLDDGRYRLEISVEDSSLTADDQSPQPFAKGIPQFRSFRLSNETALLRDGQSTQLTTATEKVSGEVVKVDVTLTVVK